jgi:DNA-binding NtrC family response regulator
MPNSSDDSRLVVLVVEDHADSRDWLQVLLARAGYDVLVASDGEEALAACEQEAPALAVVDVMLPDMDGVELFRQLKARHPDLSAIIMTGHGTIAGAVDAIAAGAFNYVEKPVDTDALLALLSAAGARARMALENRRLQRLLEKGGAGFGDILTLSPRMRELQLLVEAAAPTRANVLITGENGTGKELVANAIHARSAVARGPFIKVNCAAIPENLIESELFGHRRGAFTGAVGDRVGLMEQARGGSLLLDEISEMPVQLQAKLLRVLQERAIRPLGGDRVVEVDFRLLCASNADLREAVSCGEFREDLYYRVNTVTITVPPLRERPEDIPLLAHASLRRYRELYSRPAAEFSPEALEALRRHWWPGNVRELQHAVERAVLLAPEPVIGVDDLPESLRPAPAPAVAAPAELVTLEEAERRAVIRAMEHCDGNKRAAAAVLGIHRPTLYSKLRKYGLIDPATDRADAGEGAVLTS